ncbi:hypothetical protein DFH07DRAFT_765529 [Mycena maculata]|uniref:Uncharacterized protein n=1 Tax=Mycena maculata TaxID=230809 RepID=A0AAD7NYB6_9AGAR|nr:hypothetical protein DFH07DRAFT_765529 [Mycena maculata]
MYQTQETFITTTTGSSLPCQNSVMKMSSQAGWQLLTDQGDADEGEATAACSAARDSVVRAPTDLDRQLARNKPIAISTTGMDMDIFLCGTSAAARKGAEHWERGNKLAGIAYAALGVGAWALASHGGSLITAPVAILHKRLHRASAPSDTAVRIDMVARALIELRRAGAVDEAAGAALQETEARIATDADSSVRNSQLLHTQCKLTRRMLYTGKAPREHGSQRLDCMPDKWFPSANRAASPSVG